MSHRAAGILPHGIGLPGQSPQAPQDLSCYRSEDRRAAGLGPRIRHHRFPDAARSEDDFACRAQPIPRSAYAVTLRALRRAVALGFALAHCVFSYWRVRIRGRITLVQRSQWLHESACRILRALEIRTTTHGRPPTQGLVVANHLSYLDIAIISAVMPCFFVSKAEIAAWPYFGRAARTGGTLFIDRK